VVKAYFGLQKLVGLSPDTVYRMGANYKIDENESTGIQVGHAKNNIFKRNFKNLIYQKCLPIFKK
jgi:hypothetical protein